MFLPLLTLDLTCVFPQLRLALPVPLLLAMTRVRTFPWLLKLFRHHMQFRLHMPTFYTFNGMYISIQYNAFVDSIGILNI